jgi:hypothetical protein
MCIVLEPSRNHEIITLLYFDEKRHPKTFILFILLSKLAHKSHCTERWAMSRHRRLYVWWKRAKVRHNIALLALADMLPRFSFMLEYAIALEASTWSRPSPIQMTTPTLAKAEAENGHREECQYVLGRVSANVAVFSFSRHPQWPMGCPISQFPHSSNLCCLYKQEPKSWGLMNSALTISWNSRTYKTEPRDKYNTEIDHERGT